MIPYDKREGKIWYNNELVDWQDVKLHVLSHGLHYASCVFEGERVYDGDIFKLDEHTSRFFHSARRIGFEIQYSDENNELQHPFQTSWGVSTRLIGMIIMAHGDDKGLQLPPKLAPTQSVLIPIIPNEDSKSDVLETVNKLHEELRESYRMKIDDRDNISPGFKFNEWELKGVPLRIEIGPKDIEKNSVVFSRRDGVDGKNSISINEVSQKLKDNLDDIQSNLLETSKNFRKDNTIHVDSKAELIDTLNSTPGFVTCYWDENTSDEIEIKDLTKATLRCYLLENEGSAKAVNNESVEGKKAIFSKAY